MTRELTDEQLGRYHFEWIASSPGSARSVTPRTGAARDRWSSGTTPARSRDAPGGRASSGDRDRRRQAQVAGTEELVVVLPELVRRVDRRTDVVRGPVHLVAHERGRGIDERSFIVLDRG